jgi:hypothetical protein
MQAATEKEQKESLLEYYLRVRKATEQLCEPLEIEDYIPQPVVDVSPPKWNIAHTTWFFEEMVLKKFAPEYKIFDPDFAFLFNSYYNSVGTRTARDHRSLSRPTVKRVFEYRKHVDEYLQKLLSDSVFSVVPAVLTAEDTEGTENAGSERSVCIFSSTYCRYSNTFFTVGRLRLRWSRAVRSPTEL